MPYRPLILLTLVLCFFRVTQAQTKEDILKGIRQTFQEVNQDRTLRTISLDADDFLDFNPDNGGELTGYFKKDTLCKMVAEVGPSYGMVRFEYYFSHGQLVFIYETEKSFPTTDSSMDHSRLVLNFEGRYYLDKGAVVDIKLKGKRRSVDKIDASYVHELVKDVPPYEKSLRKHLKK